MISDEFLWYLASGMYKPYYKKEGFVFDHMPRNSGVIDSTSSQTGSHASYESHGLQVSLIKVNGQYVVAARGTANEGKDFAADYDLTDPDGYKKPSQFKDFNRFIEKMHKLHPDFDPHKAVYTGHSLGGTLATQAAVHYDAHAAVFSAPSAYNQLTPIERAKVWLGAYQTRIKNSKHPNDAIPNLPGLSVPTVGRQVFTPNYNSDPTKLKTVKDRKTAALYKKVGIEGHSTSTMDEKNFNQGDHSVAEMPFLSGMRENTYSNLTSAGAVIFAAGTAWAAIRTNPTLNSYISTTGDLVEKGIPVVKKAAKAGKIALQKTSVNSAITSLKSTKEPLKEIKKINSSLYPAMQKKFKQLTRDACELPYITAGDVADVVAKYHLEPKHHIDLDAVESVNKMVDDNIERVDSLIKGLKTAAEHIEQDDKKWSAEFAPK